CHCPKPMTESNFNALASFVKSIGDRPDTNESWNAIESQLETKVPEDYKAFVSSRSEEHTSELQSRGHLVCRLLLEKKKKNKENKLNNKIKQVICDFQQRNVD